MWWTRTWSRRNRGRSVTGSPPPWPITAVAAALAQELQAHDPLATPYVVEHNDRVIQVTLDLAL